MTTPESAFLADLLARHFVPKVVLPIDLWADEHRILPRATSAEAGLWRTSRTPYLRQILRDLSDDSPYDDVVLMFGTQLGKSECGLNWLASIIDQTPAPVMVVQPTVELGKRFSKQRIAPMIAECPQLREKVRDARERESGNTMLMKEFPDGALIITGANSASGLASMPAKFLFLDERDDYPDDVEGQGDPKIVASARQDTFQGKRLTSSSPKRPKGQSKIEAEYEAGTRFHLFVPCPDCDDRFTLKFELLRMVAPDRVVAVCPHCGSEIDEHQKTQMLERGEWIAEDPDAEVRSYQLNSLHSPVGWLSWLDLKREFDEAVAAAERGDDTKLKAFFNTRLAKTYEEKTDKVESDELKDRADDYPLRQVPEGAFVLTAGIDVQDDRVEVKVDAWGPGEESWTIDYVKLSGDPALDSSWQALDDYLDTEFEAADGRRLRIRAEAIDTGGHFTHETYAFVRARQERGKRTFATKGASKPGLPIKSGSSMVDVNVRGKLVQRGLRLWMVGTDSAKDLLHNRLRMKRTGPGYAHLTKELPDEFFAGMTNEERKRIRTGRGWRSAWMKKAGGRRNEPWDCSVLALFAAHALDLHRWTQEMFDKLRARQIAEAAQRAETEAAAAEGQGQPAAAPAPRGPSQRFARPFAPGRGNFVKSWG